MSSTIFSVDAFRAVLANADQIQNPHPVYGHFHGPWVNPNGLHWYPPSMGADKQRWETKYPNRRWEEHWRPPVSNEANDEAPDSIVISCLNGRICQAVVDDMGTMCGATFKSNPGLRRHLRVQHRGICRSASTASASGAHLAAARSAWMLCVVTGGWRNANFAQEPRIPTADIAEMCTALERMTAKHPSLAQEFGGTVFHRRVRR
ncbi:hypothetical protein ZTR_09376 [Talaromyces verruculosus]|nr:hypothetical protein ZTR_09376 [Talaromyces verruculosus]